VRAAGERVIAVMVANVPALSGACHLCIEMWTRLIEM